MSERGLHRALLREARHVVPVIGLYAALHVLVKILPLGAATGLQEALDAIGSRDEALFWRGVVLVAACGVGLAVLRAVSRWTASVAEESLGHEARCVVATTLTCADLDRFEEQGRDAASTLNVDTRVVAQVLVRFPLAAASLAVQAAGSFWILSMTHRVIAFVALGTIPIVAAVQVLLSRRTRTVHSAARQIEAQASADIEEAWTAAPSVRAQGLLRDARQVFDARETSIGALLRRQAQALWRTRVSMSAIALVPEMAVIGSAVLAPPDTYSPGGLIAALVVVEALRATFYEVSTQAAGLGRCAAAWRRLASAYSIGSHRWGPPAAGTQREGVRSSLRLSNVRYRYPLHECPDAPFTLHVGELSVGVGEIVALAGDNGSGKSTLLRLLGGLYRPGEGTIEVDGTPCPAAELRRISAYVPSAPQLFYGSILANVVAGTGERRSHQEAARAMQVSGLQEMLERNGHTPLDSVGERAVRVSRGEARTIAFARAIARRPPSVLLIDEAGSALDREAERAMCAYLERHRSAHACVIASHHGRVLGMADRVITMKDGKIVDDRDR